VSSRQPLSVVWWLVSRASGTVALVLISLSVILGLTMAAKVLRQPASRRTAATLHEHMALVALVAIAVHGVSLLGDHWLHPGWRGIAVPFALSYRPGATGIGIIAGYLAVLLGPSFYARRRIGARRWRSLHRGIGVVWVMAAVHTLGAGTDGGRMWLRIIVLAPVAPIVYLLVVRVALTGSLPRSSRPARSSEPQRHTARTADGRHTARTADGRHTARTADGQL
jgi:methionine sulfoxide reductase heme-binding subunit